MKSMTIQKQITVRESEAFKRYLSDVNKIPRITVEEERVLAEKAFFHGDEKAANELVEANLRFAISIAKQYSSTGVKIEDLVSEANHGLHIAARRFDPTNDNKFISYAVWWIRRKITDFLSNHSRTIRIPTNKVGDLSKIKTAITNLEQKLERLPSTDEIAVELDGTFTADQIDFTLDMSGNGVSSLDKSDEDGFALMDVIEDNSILPTDHLVRENEMKDNISSLLDSLTPTQREAVTLLYGLGGGQPMTLKEAGTVLHVSRERVRQLREKALRVMRVKIRKYGLSNVFDSLDD